MNTLSPTQLLDILTQMKTLATNDPARATELLEQAPQLGYAVFQALLLMGLVSPEAINAVLETGSNAPPPAAAPQVYGGYSTATPPAPTGYGVPPPAQPAVAAAAPQDPNDLLQAVLALPEEMIGQLPEVERQQVLALRAQYAAQRR